MWLCVRSHREKYTGKGQPPLYSSSSLRPMGRLPHTIMLLYWYNHIRRALLGYKNDYSLGGVDSRVPAARYKIACICIRKLGNLSLNFSRCGYHNNFSLIDGDSLAASFAGKRGRLTMGMIILYDGGQLSSESWHICEVITGGVSVSSLPAIVAFKVTNTSATCWRVADALASTSAALGLLRCDMEYGGGWGKTARVFITDRLVLICVWVIQCVHEFLETHVIVSWQSPPELQKPNCCICKVDPHFCTFGWVDLPSTRIFSNTISSCLNQTVTMLFVICPSRWLGHCKHIYMQKKGSVQLRIKPSRCCSVFAGVTSRAPVKCNYMHYINFKPILACSVSALNTLTCIAPYQKDGKRMGSHTRPRGIPQADATWVFRSPEDETCC